MRKQTLLSLTCITYYFLCSCSSQNDSTSKNRSEGAKKPASELPESLTVIGSLAIGANVSGSEPPKDASSLLTNQPVELRSLNGDVVASGKTTSNGAFTIALDTTAMGLTAAPNQMLREATVVEFVGVVKRDHADKVQGVKRTLVINSQSLTQTTDGALSLNLETNTTKGIGAIRGKVVLEGGANPVGTDIYIPGSSFNAKADELGEFTLAFLNPGSYDVRVEKDGYGSFLYSQVKVEKDDTTALADITLTVSKGPVIESLATADGQAWVRSPEVRLHFATRNAVKYKLSQWSDFRYAVYAPIDLGKMPQEAFYVLTGGDGPVTLYLRVADADGLEVDATLSLTLDSALPISPKVEIVSEESLSPGYSNTRNIEIAVDNCYDTAKLFIKETAVPAPLLADFVTPCSTVNKVAYELEDGDGVHELYIWALDATNQVSEAPSTIAVVLDRSAPDLTILPANGAYNTPIHVISSLSEMGSIFYSIDGSVPTRDSSAMSENLILVGNTTLKVIGYDLAGNASAVTTRNFTMDTNAPILGSIAIPGDKQVTNSRTIIVNVSAINADSLMLGESPTFAGGVWQPYTSSPTYTFVTDTNETKTIYVKFRDDAGNQLGQNGEIFARIRYDSSLPGHSGITLFYPETPSGSFDKMLLWQNTKPEANTYYEIEVHRNDSYTDMVRSGMSAATSWKVLPAFTSTGNYYWRVRIVDEANNKSPWVEGGSDKRFEIKLFGKAYVSTERIDAPGTSEGYGTKLVKRSGANDVYLVSSVKDPESACAVCSSVQLINWETKDVIHTFKSDSGEADAFGAVISQCDLTGDGVDEVAVAAPLKRYQKTVDNLMRSYSNAGAVYVFDGVSNNLVFTYTLDPNYPESSCNERYPSGECKTYGWKDWYDNNFQNFLWIDSSRQLTGIGLACQRESGNDTLVVGSPGWSNGGAQAVGKVEFVRYTDAAPHFAVSPTSLSGAIPPNEYQIDQFGRSIQYLSKLTMNGHDGPAIVVSAPGRGSGGSSRGAVLVYDTSLALKATIAGSTDYENFGSTISNLGNLNQDSDGYEEFAVSGSGVVRIYNGKTSGFQPGVFKSIKRLGNESYGFGVTVAAVGDITGDGFSEIAVSNPTQMISGNWGAGAVYIYDYVSLDETDATQVDEQVLYKITGAISANTYLGQSILPGKDLDNNGTIDSVRLSVAGSSNGRGSIDSFSLVSMAPSLPSSIDGASSGAAFGYRVISIPDLDGDGTNDFAVSSPQANFVYQSVGRIDFVSGRNNGILKSIYGRQQGQKLGIDIVFFNNSLFVLDQVGVMVRIDKNDIMFVNDINDYANGSWNYRYSRRTLSYSMLDRIGLVQEPMNVGEIYAPDDWSKKVGIHSTAQSWDGSATRYGSLAVYDSFIFGNYAAAQCDTDSGCQCVIYGPTSSQEFGYSATFVSDLNGDDIVDIAIGAPSKDNGDGTKGTVYIFDGRRCVNQAILNVDEAIFEITPSSLVSDARTTRFGANLVSVTDLDAADPSNGSLLITNTHWYDTSSTSVAELFIASHSMKQAKLVHGDLVITAFTQNPSDGNNISITMTKSTEPSDVYTSTCSASGNNVSFNLAKIAGNISAYPYSIVQAVKDSNDCRNLITVNIKPYQNAVVQELATTNLTGGSSGSLRSQAHLEMAAGSRFGANIVNLGDTNRDGYPELAIATPKAQGMSSATAGQVGIYSIKALVDEQSAANYPRNAEIIKFYSPTPGFANFGASLAQSDVNGDGIVDFLIGAPLYSSSTLSNVGSVYVYYVKGVESQ